MAACELLGVGFLDEFGFGELVEAGVGNRDGEGDEVGEGTEITADVVTCVITVVTGVVATVTTPFP